MHWSSPPQPAADMPPPEVLHLWGLLLETAIDGPVDPGVPVCGACGSQAFENLAPTAASVALLKCLRCRKRWLLAADALLCGRGSDGTA